MPKTDEIIEEPIVDGEPENPDPNAQALEILKGIEATLKNGGAAPKKGDPAPVATFSEYRDKVKAETGWTDAQVDFHIKSLGEVQGEVMGKLHMNDLREKHKEDFDKLRPAIDEELKRYPPAMKGDVALIENIYFMVKGKNMSGTPIPPAAKPPVPNKGGAGAPTRRIVSDFPNPDPGLDGGAGGGEGKVLSDQEKQLARGMGISEADWDKAKQSQIIRRKK